MKTYKNLIFDLGGVLWKLDFNNLLKKVQTCNSDITKKDLEIFIKEVLIQFNESKINEEEIYTKYKTFLRKINLSKENIIAVHCSLLEVGPTKVMEMLHKLKMSYCLILLSNTDRWHIRYVERNYPEINNLFAHRIYSFDAGCSKPEKDIFYYLKKATKINFSESIFFDDNQDNIDTAKKLYLDAVLVENEDNLVYFLKEHILQINYY